MRTNIGITPLIFIMREIVSGEYESESARSDCAKIPFCETKAEDNGFRIPPGFNNKQNVSSAKPDIPISSLSPEGGMLGPDRPLPRRKFEAAPHVGDDSTSHIRKGGEKWAGNLKKTPKGNL